jgi:hypothetical protein
MDQLTPSRTIGEETMLKLKVNLLKALVVFAFVAGAVALQTAAVKGQQAPGTPKEDNLAAIDILLEPDSTMLQHAEANNARLLKVFPMGYTLDAEHRPHITLVQRFVRTADLEKVYAAAGKVFAGANVPAMKLEAFKYYYALGGAFGIAGICARPTPEILKLQAEIIAAVEPFAVKTGPISTFTAPKTLRPRTRF